MAVDVSSLTVDNLTPEIMTQMNRDEIAAFKAKLTPEQLQILADKLGGSQAAPPDDENAVATPETSTFVVDVAQIPAEQVTANTSNPETPTEQKGPIVFGRR